MAKTATSTPASDGMRRNRDANVMAAAVEVMSERGYAATTIQEVADRVGVLKGSLYHYFSSKEELLFRILEESHQQNAEIVASVKASKSSAIEELLEYLRQSAAWHLANVERANIFFTESRHLTGARRDKARQDSRAYVHYIQELLEKARADGDVRDDIDVRLVTRFVLGALNSVRSWPAKSGSQIPAEDIVQSFTEMIKSSILPPRSL